MSRIQATGNSFLAYVDEDATVTVLARLCSLDGAGVEVFDEGKTLTVADVSRIDCYAYLLGASRYNPSPTALNPPLTTPAFSLRNALSLTGWDYDLWGWNFLLNVSPQLAAEENSWYSLEVKLTLATGAIHWLKGVYKTKPIQSS
jgi:hypothetical protein